MTRYGVATEYDRSEGKKRQIITVWSPPFFSVFEAEGRELPNQAGFMLTTYNGDKVRVECPAPRSDENYPEVDAAIGSALDAHHAARGAQQQSTTRKVADDLNGGFFTYETCEVCHNILPTHDRYCPRQPGAFPKGAPE